MRKLTFCISVLLLLTVNILWAQRGMQPGSEDDTSATMPEFNTYALMVGVSTYDHHPNLTNPVPDMEAIEEELREVYGCKTEMLRNPTHDEFLMALHALADKQYGPDDQLLVFFSGHGWYDERIKRGYLILKDTRDMDDDPLYNTYVSHEDVRTVLERLDCQHVLLMVDSCFSGTLDPTIATANMGKGRDIYSSAPRPEYIRRKLRYKTRRYITSGGKVYVPDGRPGQHSPFARRVLESLRTFGGDDGILTLEEMMIEVEKATPEPRIGEMLDNEPGSSFVLIASATALESHILAAYESAIANHEPLEPLAQMYGIGMGLQALAELYGSEKLLQVYINNRSSYYETVKKYLDSGVDSSTVLNMVIPLANAGIPFEYIEPTESTAEGEMAQKEFNLIVIVTPEDAGVTVEALDTALRGFKRKGKEFQLPVGRYSITATLSGYEAANQETYVNVDGITVNLTLSKRIVNMPTEITGNDGAPMVLIPAGEFQMGSNDGNDGEDDEKPVHTVYVDAFYMDKYEVTNELYKKFIDATGHKNQNPISWDDTRFNVPDEFKSTAPNQPVVDVTWHDAKAYAEWAGKRLPTEAEWEKAARGGLVGRRYPRGNDITHDDANYGGTGGKDIWDGVAPVGRFPPNGYGLYDMAGNACEWCSDWYEENGYSILPQRNPTGPAWGIGRILRGGSWLYNSSYLRVTARTPNNPSYTYINIGFRCVQDVTP